MKTLVTNKKLVRLCYDFKPSNNGEVFRRNETPTDVVVYIIDPSKRIASNSSNMMASMALSAAIISEETIVLKEVAGKASTSTEASTVARKYIRDNNIRNHPALQ